MMNKDPGVAKRNPGRAGAQHGLLDGAQHGLLDGAQHGSLDGAPDSSSDGAAAALSSLCLLHCLLLPLGLGLAPVLSGLSDELLHGPVWLHWALIALAAPVSVRALWMGMELHGEGGPWKLALVGFLLMAGGALMHGMEPLEQLLTVMGGLVVASAHWRNWKARNRQ